MKNQRKRFASLFDWIREGQLYVVYILVFAILAYLIGIAFYRWNFGSHISDDPAVWGLFGDYLGGVLNPLLSILGFVLIAIGLAYSAKQLGEERRARWEERAYDQIQKYWSDEMIDVRRNAWRFGSTYIDARDCRDGDCSGGTTLKAQRAERVLSSLYDWAILTGPVAESALIDSVDVFRNPEIFLGMDVESRKSQIHKELHHFHRMLQFIVVLGYSLEKLEDNEDELILLFGNQLTQWCGLFIVYVDDLEKRQKIEQSEVRHLFEVSPEWQKQMKRLIRKRELLTSNTEPSVS